MRKTLTIATGLLSSAVASAALVGTAERTWNDTDSTPWDAGVDELYAHLEGSGNLYHDPDSGENRFSVGGTLGPYMATGYDSIQLYNLATEAAEVNVFGVRVMVGDDSYELSLTPNSASSAATDHYFTTVNDILAATGGPTLEVAGMFGGTTTEWAEVDFFINNISEGVKIYSSEIGFDPELPQRPAFDFTPDLLEDPGPSMAAPLPGGSSAAMSFLTDAGFEVWGLEDSPQSEFPTGAGEPDYNDRIFAFRIVPVPEPSTYGLIGAAALAGAIALRHRRRKTVA